MSEFKRETRYIVLKLKHLNEEQLQAIEDVLDDNKIGTVECVVVESDWDCYEETWYRIENECSEYYQRKKANRLARDGTD